jgi:hypothetical protein
LEKSCTGFCRIRCGIDDRCLSVPTRDRTGMQVVCCSHFTVRCKPLAYTEEQSKEYAVPKLHEVIAEAYLCHSRIGGRRTVMVAASSCLQCSFPASAWQATALKDVQRGVGHDGKPISAQVFSFLFGMSSSKKQSLFTSKLQSSSPVL